MRDRAEAIHHLDRTVQFIKSFDCQAGCALNPATPLTAIECILPRLDFVMCMTVNPGYAGQQIVPYVLDKIAELRKIVRASRRDIKIEVDGNVSPETIPDMIRAGADILVGGSSLFRRDIPLTESLKTMCALIGGLGGE